VHEVEPTWRSLDEEDVFILDRGDKIWVWQGKGCSPMEKAKAAQVVHDMTLAKHVDVEVISQTESRSHRFVKELGGGEEDGTEAFHSSRPIRLFRAAAGEALRPRRLFRLSDASGRLTFELVGEGGAVSKGNLEGNDVFLLDDSGRQIFVWEGRGASKAERAMWLRIAQAYVRQLQDEDEKSQAYLLPITNLREGRENFAFLKAIEAA
jgi:gelsolin